MGRCSGGGGKLWCSHIPPVSSIYTTAPGEIPGRCGIAPCVGCLLCVGLRPGGLPAERGDACSLQGVLQHCTGMFASCGGVLSLQGCLQHTGMLVVHRNVCIVRGCVWHAGMLAVLRRSHRCLQQFFSLAPSLCLSFPLLRASTALELWDSAHCCRHPNDGFV